MLSIVNMCGVYSSSEGWGSKIFVKLGNLFYDVKGVVLFWVVTMSGKGQAAILILLIYNSRAVASDFSLLLPPV